jgi:NAD-dependent deacetylase
LAGDIRNGDKAVAAAAAAVVAARRPICLTGAGLSVPSGIPDFRSEGGLWRRYDIEEYATEQAFSRNPLKCWELFRAMDEVIEAATPNPAHTALARLEQLGRLEAVITQNIDNLHTRAGSRKVLEFHGSTSSLTCPECLIRFTRAEAGQRLKGPAPVCSCGAVLKPDIVLFGDPIPREVMRESFALANRADLILVVGTSATVAPACLLPDVVASRGGLIIEMSLESTELTARTDIHVRGDVSTTLPAVLALVEGSRP